MGRVSRRLRRSLQRGNTRTVRVPIVDREEVGDEREFQRRNMTAVLVAYVVGEYQKPDGPNLQDSMDALLESTVTFAMAHGIDKEELLRRLITWHARIEEDVADEAEDEDVRAPAGEGDQAPNPEG